MDLIQLMNACLAGLATGGFTVLGEALTEKTKLLFDAYAAISDKPVSSNPLDYEPAHAATIALSMKKVADSDEDFASLLAAWRAEAESQIKHIEKTRDKSCKANVVKGLSIKNSFINQING